VLIELGLDAPEIVALRDAGAVGPAYRRCPDARDPVRTEDDDHRRIP
jgi:hypothetical protein